MSKVDKKTEILESLAIIETEQKHVVKVIDNLMEKLPILLNVNARVKTLEDKIKVFEYKQIRKDLIIWGMVLSSLSAFSFKIYT